MKEEIMVTIHCTVYNHEPYLRQCLDGFAMQQTDFLFEAVVHDDCSTDGSAAIIKEYAERYPNIIKPIFEKENQYSKHDGSLRRILQAHTHGKYIAICEGDDYWTDPTKLQRQVNFMEQSPDYAAVAENGWILQTDINRKKEFSFLPERDINITELIEGRKFPTASVLYRASLEEDYQKYNYSIDTFLWCYLTTRGKFRYFTNKSSVYRRGPQGITEYTDPLKWAKIVEALNLNLIKYFGDHFDVRIAKRNIKNNYMGALKKYLYLHKRNDSYKACLRKCFSMAPVRTSLTLLRGLISTAHRQYINMCQHA
jgi:glycosyltransferase involved in cell wall biosynthesis